MWVDDEISDAKQRVLDCAERLFMEKGYAAITLREIADTLGIRQASLYYHFPEGKEQLYVEMAERVFARHRAGMEEAVLCAEPGLQTHLRAIAAWLASQPSMNFIGMMHADLPALSPANAKHVSQAAYRAMFGPLRAVFVAAQQRGEARAGNPDLMAGFFLALMDGVTFSLTQQQHHPRTMLSEEAIRLMIEGVAGRGQPPS